jgi:hypothetical protein
MSDKVIQLPVQYKKYIFLGIILALLLAITQPTFASQTSQSIDVNTPEITYEISSTHEATPINDQDQLPESEEYPTSTPAGVATETLPPTITETETPTPTGEITETSSPSVTPTETPSPTPSATSTATQTILAPVVSTFSSKIDPKVLQALQDNPGGKFRSSYLWLTRPVYRLWYRMVF